MDFQLGIWKWFWSRSILVFLIGPSPRQKVLAENGFLRFDEIRFAHKCSGVAKTISSEGQVDYSVVNKTLFLWRKKKKN